VVNKDFQKKNTPTETRQAAARTIQVNILLQKIDNADDVTYAKKGGCWQRTDSAELDWGEVGTRPDVVLSERRMSVDTQRASLLVVAVRQLRTKLYTYKQLISHTEAAQQTTRKILCCWQS